MSSFYSYGHQQPTPAAAPAVSHTHHGSRNRRAPRVSSVSQNANKSFRNVRPSKDLGESLAVMNYRQRIEAIRSFDLEDDMEFCPALLTDSDIFSIHSTSASERSSLASNSPESSPTQQPQQIAPAYVVGSCSPPYMPPAFHAQQSSVKIHQPSATRARNAIPIINPTTGISMTSPSPSVSPSRMQPSLGGRRW